MARSRTLKDVPPLRFGEGRDCTLPACLALATGADYEWVMGASGAAFATTIDAATWDPLAAAPLDDATLARGARAVGKKLDIVGPPFDRDMSALVLDRVAESVDAKTPVLVRGISGPPEYGLIVGYDDEGPTFLARTYFDKTDKPTRVTWDAFADETHGRLAFLDDAPDAGRPAVARDAVREVARTAPETLKALRAWAEGVRDDARWSDTRHAGAAAFADHAMRQIHVDKRRAAARFLRGARALFAGSPGAELLRAAESYGYSADAAEKIGVGTFDGSVAMRFLDAGHRRAWAKQLDAILRHEQEAQSALAAAEGEMR